MAVKKSSTKQINFKKIDWEKVDMEKVKYFYREALAYNNGVIDDIRSLNDKAFSLLSCTAPILAAAVGGMFSIWEKDGYEALAFALIPASAGLGLVLLLLFLAVFPRGFHRGEGAPEAFFSGEYYTAAMYTIFTGGIATLHKYIGHNYKIMKYRGNFIVAAIITLIATIAVTVSAFFLYPLWS
jgi:hypothetical protein